jgi:hypothetical protein
MNYIIQTKDTVYHSKRKLDTSYKHVSFKYKDRARYKEVCDKKLAFLLKRFKGVQL